MLMGFECSSSDSNGRHLIKRRVKCLKKEKHWTSVSSAMASEKVHNQWNAHGFLKAL
jgi:hypothetical protein